MELFLIPTTPSRPIVFVDGDFDACDRNCSEYGILFKGAGISASTAPLFGYSDASRLVMVWVQLQVLGIDRFMARNP